ncbi:hypothetical protein V8G54_011091 [Vigna mungo]|uniref:Uncharacterized protein n=1 Tax=Vigna mungo TaxID=3915 RepID=A0AAQ3NQU3_VIGMU
MPGLCSKWGGVLWFLFVCVLLKFPYCHGYSFVHVVLSNLLLDVRTNYFHLCYIMSLVMHFRDFKAYNSPWLCSWSLGAWLSFFPHILCKATIFCVYFIKLHA